MMPNILYARRFPVLLLAAALAAGCGGEAGEPRITGGAESLDALGQTVWESLVRTDSAALEQLRLTEYEHNELVWPELPASRPEANFPVSYAWQNITTRNRAALEELLPRVRGSTWSLQRIECGGREEFETFEVLTECTLNMETRAGETRRVQAFKHVLVMDGGYKVFRYYGG